MAIDQNGIKLIQVFENCWKPDGKGNFLAYPDAKKIPTIGWGSIRLKGRSVRLGDVITQAEADRLLEQELRYISDCVDFLTHSVKLTQAQRNALISFAYNVGPDMDHDGVAEGLGDSTLLKKVLANPLDPTIKDEFVKWRNKGTSFEKGLCIRRLSEAHMYFTGELKYTEHDWASEIKQIMKT